MKIDQNTYNTWMNLLDKSRKKEVELGSFGLYSPSKDKVLGVIDADDHYDWETGDSRFGTLDHVSSVREMITAFNKGELKYIQIGGRVQYNNIGSDVMVFSYHTHPSDNQLIGPSDQDADRLMELGSPLEVILSGAALQWTDKPFTLAYHPDFIPERERDVSKVDLFKIEEEAKKMNIPVPVLAELASIKHNTGLYPSINIEITK